VHKHSLLCLTERSRTCRHDWTVWWDAFGSYCCQMVHLAGCRCPFQCVNVLSMLPIPHSVLN